MCSVRIKPTILGVVKFAVNRGEAEGKPAKILNCPLASPDNPIRIIAEIVEINSHSLEREIQRTRGR